MLSVATVQFQHKAGDKTYNHQRIEAFCQQAADQKIKIIAFPEMCITGYWHVHKLDKHEIEQLAESVPHGPSCQSLTALSKRHDMIIGAGLIEQTKDGRLFNSYVVAMPDGRIECHRKLHCFISPHMSSGNSFTVFDTHLGVRIGVLICYDNNIIENVRATALLGADILLAPHQTGGTQSRSPHAMGRINPALWENRHTDPEALKAELIGPKGRGWLMRWLPSRAHDNGLFILFSNGIGLDVDEIRTGNAMVIDCYGRIQAETDEMEDTLVQTELDLELLALCSGRRWIRGRRPELYHSLYCSIGDRDGGSRSTILREAYLNLTSFHPKIHIYNTYLPNLNPQSLVTMDLTANLAIIFSLSPLRYTTL